MFDMFLMAPDQPMGYPSAATTSPSLTGEVAIGSHAAFVEIG
jgi:hypothetical protein